MVVRRSDYNSYDLVATTAEKFMGWHWKEIPPREGEVDLSGWEFLGNDGNVHYRTQFGFNPIVDLNDTLLVIEEANLRGIKVELSSPYNESVGWVATARSGKYALAVVEAETPGLAAVLAVLYHEGLFNEPKP